MSARCPSSRPDVGGSEVFGIVGGPPGSRRVQFLPLPVPVTPELRRLSRQAGGPDGPPALTEFLRFSGPCVRSACRHFSDERCTLGDAVVASVPESTPTPPPCPIRSGCRWYAQSGVTACTRCPAVVTDTWDDGDGSGSTGVSW